MPPPLRTRARRAARSALVRGAAALLALLPPGLALRLGAGLGRLAWALLPATRRDVLAHLAIAFPELPERDRRALGRECLGHLGQVAAEVALLRRLAPRLDDYVRLAPGAEARVRAAVARGRGVVVATGHLGNWELLARRLAPLVRPAAVIARRTGTPWADRALAALRAEAGLETLWRDDPGTARRMLRLLRQGGTLGLLVDQDTRVQGLFVPFFGRPAFTPRAVGDLATRFGAAVLVVTCHRRGPRPGDGHELEVCELPPGPCSTDRESEVRRVTAAVARLHEHAIRRYPAEWVWMHRRWRRTPDLEAVNASSKVGAENL